MGNIKVSAKRTKNQVALSIRRIGKSGVTNIKEFYQLFPNAPLKPQPKLPVTTQTRQLYVNQLKFVNYMSEHNRSY
ncbi:MAG: hypothetical protein IPL50_17900 [Chitinophagaceae bacterium]|nr:hypothetical protein [Chitinophagaceae bacterium]